MGLKDHIKLQYLSEILCPAGVTAVSPDFVLAMEDLADTNKDGHLTLEEFENAYEDTSGVVATYCVGVEEEKIDSPERTRIG